MKYKLIGENDYLFSLKEIIAKNRGVPSLNVLINLDSSVENSPYLLDNIEKARDLLIKHLNNMSRIHILQDSDFDGVTSATMLYNYLKEIYDEKLITWNTHKGKEHGIILEEFEGLEFDLLICPDSASSDFKEHKILKEKGIDIIVLDHHIADRESEDAIIVNNQLSKNYPNKSLSAVGIVYKFLQVLDECFNLDKSKDYLDMVAFGLIADCMDTREPETRYYINEGIKNVKNHFLKALIKKQSFSIKRLNITSISFYIVPLVNALFRIGSIEERKDLFRAFTDSKTLVPYKKRGSDIETEILFYEDFARRCSNLKNKQNKERDKYVDILKEQVDKFKTDKHNLLVINSDFIENKNFTGLIANKLAGDYIKPTLILSENKEKGVYTGSGRNFNRSPIESLKKEIEVSKLANYVAGHDNAFGLGIKKENIRKLVNYFNNLDIDLREKVFMVDFIMKEFNITKEIVIEFDSLVDLYGQEFKEPMVAVKDVMAKEVKFNDKMTVMSFVGKNNIKYVKFFPTDKDLELLSNKNSIIEIVGSLSINEFNGNKTYQFVIEDYNVLEYIEETKEELDFDW